MDKQRDALAGVRLAALEAMDAGATLEQTQLECAEAWAVRRRVRQQSVEAVEDLRYPANRPGWLGTYQSWPCGRCGRDVDDSQKHQCSPTDPAEGGGVDSHA